MNKTFQIKLNLLIAQTKPEGNVTLQNQETSQGKNVTQSSLDKHTRNDTEANNSKRLGNKKFVVILADTMTKQLNGWGSAKRKQSNCKIYVKTFSRARFSFMENYMKPS